MAAEALILVTIGVLLTAYQANVRRQRVGLRSGAEVARRLARVDVLTGLGNRRAFDESLTIEIARAARERTPLSDRARGRRQPQGASTTASATSRATAASGEVARAMERAVRSTDRCFRWGGDEFVVVMPGTDREAADAVLGRMAERVAAACETRDGRGIALTYGAAEIERATRPPRTCSRSPTWRCSRQQSRTKTRLSARRRAPARGRASMPAAA